MSNFNESKSLQEVHQSVDPLLQKGRWKKLLSFFGPAYLVSVGYMDPGNWATDLEGGSRYGYQLIWVLLMSNIMAIVIQSFCARLGIVCKKDLAQVNRETYPPAINFCLYILAELAIAATDLAEVLGMAIGLHLLFGLPLLYGVLITVLDTFLLLFLQRLGIRKMEAFIIGLIAVIFCSFCIQLYFVKPAITEIAAGILPVLPDQYALFIAIGIIGATVMPHNLYLHSALVQTRKIGDDSESKKKAIRLNFIDSTIALNLAFFVNASILILAGAVFYRSGHTGINSIEDAHGLLEPLVGQRLAPILFALALIASGQSSTITGTLAGQVVMEGYLNLRINPWLRRVVTRMIAILPAVLTIWISGDSNMTQLLILSQVILSLQLSFAIIPLLHAVSNKERMKEFVIGKTMLILGILITAVILFLNIKMVMVKVVEFLSAGHGWMVNAAILLLLLGLMVLLMYTLFFPIFSERRTKAIGGIHNTYLPTGKNLDPLTTIGLSIDFSKVDEMILSNALRYATSQTRVVLVHVVESAGARILGERTADREAEEDLKRLEIYRNFLVQEGLTRVDIILGFQNRIQEIVRISKENEIELLIMGAHGHRGLKDILYGHTIDSVRHQLKIPVLIVQES